MTDNYSAELILMGNRIVEIGRAIAVTPPDPGPRPGPDPIPPPVGGEFSMVATADKLTLSNGVSMVLEGDHIASWGHPNETVSLKIVADRALTLQVALDYTLAAESQATGSTRNVRVGTQNKQLTLAITQDLWTERNREWTSRVTFSVPKGESVVSIINDTTAAWSNWADLFAVGLTSSDGTFSVVGINVDPGPSPIPIPDPGPIPPPVQGDYDVVVGRDGTLQQLVDRPEALQHAWKIGVPSGAWQGLYMLNKLFKGLYIFLEDGARLTGDSGIEGYGSIENFRLSCNPRRAFVEPVGNKVVGEGIFFDSTRNDKTGTRGDPSGGAITIENVVVQPRPGTGNIQRNGIGIWGMDKVTVIGVEVHHAAGNAAFGYGSAGSLISIGHARRNTRVQGQYACLLRGNLLHHAEITADGDSADRNGIILDLFHADGGGIYGDRVQGPILIEDNLINDVAGRGIQILRAGQPDSPVLVQKNRVSGRYAYGLGNDPNEGNPKSAIAGYGGGQCSSVTVKDNEVNTSQGAGKPAYQFESFDGGDGSGVKGTGNKGTPANFYNSPTNSPPSGFTS